MALLAAGLTVCIATRRWEDGLLGILGSYLGMVVVWCFAHLSMRCDNYPHSMVIHVALQMPPFIVGALLGATLPLFLRHSLAKLLPAAIVGAVLALGSLTLMTSLLGQEVTVLACGPILGGLFWLPLYLVQQKRTRLTEATA
jgi:hypothetical protein